MIFRLHGLNVRTDLPLHPAVAVSEPPQLEVSYTEGALPFQLDAPAVADWVNGSDWARLTYDAPAGQRLELTYSDGGRRLAIHSTSADARPAVSSVLRGPGISAALYLRGVPVFHGCAVSLGSCAVLLVGAAGAGKSTLTAALLRAGAGFVTEEIAAVEIDSACAVRHGYPFIPLDRAAQTALGLAARDERHEFEVRSGSALADPVPLGLVYVLRPRAARHASVDIRWLPPHVGALRLIEHLYGARWLRIPGQTRLAWSTAIATRVPVCDVVVPDSLDRLMETAGALIDDATRRASVAH